MSALSSLSVPSPCAPGQTLSIGELLPFSTVDFPGKTAAVVFLRGCPWRCHYCHNTHLQNRPGNALLGESTDPNWEQVEVFLQSRRGLLDAVVFSGGEPLADKHLLLRVQTVKALGFEVGLHTGGAYPDRLESLLPSLDWVGLDCKAPFDDYAAITTVSGSGKEARRSLERLLASRVYFECRTTVHPQLLSQEKLREMAQQLSAMGVRRYALQHFRAMGCADMDLMRSQKMAEQEGGCFDPVFLSELGQLFEQFEVRST